MRSRPRIRATPCSGRARLADNCRSDAIPPELLQQLEQLKSTLRVQGSVVRRTESDRHAGWRLRYRMRDEHDHVHHRSLPLPDETVAMAVRQLLLAWKAEYRQEQQARRQAEQVQAAVDGQERARHRQRRRQVQALAGGGRQHRRRVGKMYDEAVAKGLQAEIEFCLLEKHRLPARRPGRPAKVPLMICQIPTSSTSVGGSGPSAAPGLHRPG